MDQQRSRVDKIARHVHIAGPELIDVGQKLRGDDGDGDVVDVDVLLANQVQQQVQRAVIHLAHNHRKWRFLGAFISLFLPRRLPGSFLFNGLLRGFFFLAGRRYEHQWRVGVGCWFRAGDGLWLWLGNQRRRGFRRRLNGRGGLLKVRSRDQLGGSFRLDLDHGFQLSLRLFGNLVDGFVFGSLRNFRLNWSLDFQFGFCRFERLIDSLIGDRVAGVRKVNRNCGNECRFGWRRFFGHGNRFRL